MYIYIYRERERKLRLYIKHPICALARTGACTHAHGGAPPEADSR